MPRLDLLTEEDLYFRRVLFMDQREDRCIDCLEHFGGKGTDIVEVELECVERGSISCRVLLTCEFGRESHFADVM